MQPAEPSVPLREGDMLAGKYRVERVLGAGGMGVVVAAMHVHLRERVALKFLLPQLAHNQDTVARFLREAQAAVRIKSEHVARITDVGTLEMGAPYMVMEYLTGTDLAQVLQQRGPLPVAEAADYLLQACEAIAEAHALGLVHRDLKPANLFLTRRADGSSLVKVLDFGISKAMDVDGGAPQQALTSTTAVMGSPLYMSPEQVRSARAVDPRSDVWSLGVVLNELLTGAHPFEAETLTGLLASIVADPPEPLRTKRPDAHPALEQLIEGCLQKDPARRVQSVAHFARALAPFAPPSAQLSVERISSVLGVKLPGSGASSFPSLPPSGQTGAGVPAWGATVPTKRSSAALGLGLAAAVVLIGGGVAAFVAFGPGKSGPQGAAAATPGTSAETATTAPPAVPPTKPEATMDTVALAASAASPSSTSATAPSAAPSLSAPGASSAPPSASPPPSAVAPPAASAKPAWMTAPQTAATHRAPTGTTTKVPTHDVLDTR